MSNICQWCSNTSSTIDGMEYQIEQLKRERDALKANREILREALWGMLNIGWISSSGYYIASLESTLKGEAVLASTPKTSLSEIKKSAIYNAVEHVVRGLFTKRDVREFNSIELRAFIDDEMCRYADGLRSSKE